MGFNVFPRFHGQQILIHIDESSLEDTIVSELVVSIWPCIEHSDIEILRTCVNKRRSFKIKNDKDLKKCADIYKEMYTKLTEKYNLRQLKKKELENLPPGIGAERNPDGTYCVSFMRTMSLQALKNLLAEIEKAA